MTPLLPTLAAVIVTALCLLALRGRWVRRRRQRSIDEYPYHRFLDRRLAARHPKLDAEQRQQIFACLVEYFHLCRIAGRRMVSMPSQAVDDAWHEFILFTRHYDKFCRQSFGRFLHHTPAEAMGSPTLASEGLKRAWRLACQREGIDPKKPSRLPRLFALDALLGFQGGFIYQLDCMAAGKTGTDYCASHIGCSSGCGGGCGGDNGGSGDSGGSDGGGCGGGCGGGGD